MSVLDLLRGQNSIEHAPEPEAELALALAASAPNGAMPALPSAVPPIAAPAKADPPGIQANYYIENAGKESRYYKDLEGKQLAFRADNKAVTTKQEDRVTVSHMLDVAQARGWMSLHVRGSAAFKQEAWIEGQARGLSVKGYDPTGNDRRDVQARRAARQQSPAATMSQAVPDPNVVANTTSASAPMHAVTLTPAPVVASTASKNGAMPSTTGKAAVQAGNPTNAPAEARNGTPATAAAGAPSVAGLAISAEQYRVATPLIVAAKRQIDVLQRAIEAGESGPDGRDGPKYAEKYARQELDKAWKNNEVAHALRARGLTEKGIDADLSARRFGHIHAALDRGNADLRSWRSEQGNREMHCARAAQGLNEESISPQPDAAEKLSPSGKQVLTFLEQRIDTQMAQLSASVRADLRNHAAQTLAKREAENGPVKVPQAKSERNRAAKRDQAADPKPDQARQPRMVPG